MTEYSIDETRVTEEANSKISLPPDFPEVSEKEIKIAEERLIHLQGKIPEAELHFLAEQIARGEKARKLLVIDLQTGLYTADYARARGIEMIMEGLLKRNPPLEVAMLICDVNGLKAVNDTYGHSVGDLLLAAVGKHLLEMKELRPDELKEIREDLEEPIIPWRSHAKGDEFGLLVIGGGQKVIEACARFLQNPKPHFQLPDGQSREVHFSFGVSSTGKDADLQQLFAEAGSDPKVQAGELFQKLWVIASERERQDNSISKQNG